MLRCSFTTLLAIAHLLVACGAEDVVEPPPPDPLPEPVCTPGTRWVSGTPSFREATAQWGVAGVIGTRIAAADFDGDGWADVVVRQATDEATSFATPPACCADASCPIGSTCPAQRVFLLRNTGMGTFEDVTRASGILTNRTETDPDLGRPAQVFAFGDVDNDGDLDVFTGRGDRTDLVQTETSELMLNAGDGTFALGPADSHLRVSSGDAPSGAAFVDYDLNGLLDLFQSQNTWANNPKNDRLLGGGGQGVFTDITQNVGMVTAAWVDLADLNGGTAHAIGWGAVACDLNGDGFAELLASSYGRSPNHLWQAGGPNASFMYTNRSVDSGYAYDDRVDWSDNESARCYCSLMPMAPDCAGVPPPQNIVCNTVADAFRWNHGTDRERYRLGGNSGTTVCADVDNDGDMDLLTTEIVHWDVGSSSDPSELLLNSGEPDVRFDRPGNDVTGLTREHAQLDWNDGDISGAIFDFDNDAWPDVYIASSDYPGTKGLLFHQSTPGSFSAVPFSEGIDHNRSHGIAVADFDRDGDLDLVLGHSLARCSGSNDCYATGEVRYFENVLGQAGNWVQLALVGGPAANRAAIGARITFRGEDGVTQTKEIGGGHGHYGAQHDLVVHLGMGSACRGEVTVRWPDNGLTEQTFEVVSGYRFSLVQGGAVQVVEP